MVELWEISLLQRRNLTLIRRFLLSTWIFSLVVIVRMLFESMTYAHIELNLHKKC